jgi:formate dehydrogenase iron-sulfur subunit
LQPACATACPTASIQFGEIGELRERAEQRLATLQSNGISDATLYDPRESSVGGIHAMFIVRGDPAAFNLPPAPEVPTVYLRKGWTAAAAATVVMIAAALGAVGRK